MELIQIDSLQILYTSPNFQHLPGGGAPVLLDTETGVVYYRYGQNIYPRYDSSGRIMIIPRDSGIVERARAQSRRANAEYQKKNSIIQV